MARDRGSKQQSKRSNFRLHRSSSRRKNRKKWIKLIPKTNGNRKRDCVWGCARGINTTWENLQFVKHKSGRRSFRSPNWFVLSICRFSQVVFIPPAQPHAQSLFLFPIVFGINMYMAVLLPTILVSFRSKYEVVRLRMRPPTLPIDCLRATDHVTTKSVTQRSNDECLFNIGLAPPVSSTQ